MALLGERNSAAYVSDMLEEAEDPIEGPSEIANFYAGCDVLITGASGFLGRLLVEKILRSCPDVGNIFLLIRAKKEKSPTERFEEYFEDLVFERLKREQPEFARKVVLLEGDVGEIGLGLSPENVELLRKTNVVIHGAATVRFDEEIRKAVNINVRGTRELLRLAKEMANLKAFVHISTAFSQCVIEEIDEKFYPPPINPDKLIDLVDILDVETLDSITPVLVGKWPNTYSFTKAVAEDVVRQNCIGTPSCIVRPSMIMATSKEPISGWINNYYGPTGYCFGSGIGLIHTTHGDRSLVVDVIPADYVVNLVIAAAWGIHTSKTMIANEADFVSGDDVAENVEPTIYNAVTFCKNPITLGDLTDLNEKHFAYMKSMVILWYNFLFINKHMCVHKICEFFFHALPAAVVDSLAYLTGRKPILWNMYKKVRKFEELTWYFKMNQWRFHDRNVMALWDRAGAADRSTFDFNVESIDWDEYFYNNVRGMRMYLAKDPLETIPQGNARFAKLKVAHFTIVTILVGLLLWIVAAILQRIG